MLGSPSPLYAQEPSYARTSLMRLGNPESGGYGKNPATTVTGVTTNLMAKTTERVLCTKPETYLTANLLCLARPEGVITAKIVCLAQIARE